MRQPTIIIILLLTTLVGCESALVSNQPSGGLFALQQGGSLNIMSSTPNDPLYPQQDYLNAASVPHAWQTTHGSGSKEIAIIAMGGINKNHEDLQSRVTIKTFASSPFANTGAANPVAGIIGAATNNGKGIAGVNWAAPVLSYNIAKKTTQTVRELPSGYPITKSFIDLNKSAIAPAINDAVNAGAKTILLPINWMLKGRIPEIKLSGLQFYPCCEVENPYKLIYTNVKRIGKSIFAADKLNDNYASAINAVKNAYKNGTVVVGKALEYNGFGIGFPANLASDHVVFTVGTYNSATQLPYQYSGIPEGDVTSYNPDDINLIAPGVDMLTTMSGNTEYGTISSTGASAALATGIISLLQAAESDLTPDDITHILEKTAVPVGGPGYDDKSGHGLIDAGAAMNYVQTYDIKHGTTTDGQVQKIASNRQITLYSSAWAKLASGVYFADIYKVTYTIPLVPSTSNDLWYNAKGTYGWSAANPNDQNRYANVELFNDHATVTTYIYDLYNSIGQKIGWYPASRNNIQLHYSYVGEIATPPLSVTIAGMPYTTHGQTLYFSSDVSHAEGSVSYQWYYRQEPWSSWIADGGNSSSYQHTFYSAPGGETAHSAVKVVVTSAGETASDIHSVDVYGDGGDCQSTNTNSIGTNAIPPPCN